MTSEVEVDEEVDDDAPRLPDVGLVDVVVDEVVVDEVVVDDVVVDVDVEVEVEVDVEHVHVCVVVDDGLTSIVVVVVEQRQVCFHVVGEPCSP